jgi:hypothetical protein
MPSMSDPASDRTFAPRELVVRVLPVVGVGVAACATLYLVRGRYPQPLAYHEFADDRTFLGVPNALNVLSNLPFLLVGVWGLWFLLVGKASHPGMAYRDPAERWPFVAMFICVALTGVGSTYYHLQPNNDRLVWDRLPMAVGFMGLIAAMTAERISPRLGGRLLLPLVAIGIASVLYWHWTEQHEQGDMRLYVFIQGYSLFFVLVAPLLFPCRYTRTYDWYIGIGWYVLAKVCEFQDGWVYRALHGTLSGHTLKHLLGAVSTYWLLRMLMLRRPIANQTPLVPGSPESEARGARIMTTAAPPLTVAELKALLRAANAGAVLLPPRRLRRVIKEDRDLGGLGLQVPHRRSYTISRDRLLRLVPRDELGFAPEQHVPATLLLLERPEQDELDRQPRKEVLRRYWRWLFHARIHAVLERHLAEGKLTPAIVADRVRRLGPAVWSEIQLVLEQEHLLLPPRDEPTIYVEFAALYLELRAFAPVLASAYFPTIDDFAAVDTLLVADVEASRLLAESRPVGASDPVAAAPSGICPSSPEVVPPSETRQRLLAARAERAERKGNVVRAARLHYQRGDIKAARANLDRLAERLRDALGLDDEGMTHWREAIEPLLAPASRGIWPIEARLLYDLQKICLDRERAVFAVDVGEWAYSLGKRPIKRLLPGQTEILQVKHLRSAAWRAAAEGISPAQRARLVELLHAAVVRAEEHVRELFRPRVAEVLDDVGMRPINLPEKVARNKLTEELLDRVVEHGHLNMGNLRDAVSRNNLRLPDLSGPREFFRGDRLICANRRFSVLLDGVYRRGEFYLRWLQRLSSLAFGTVVGRVLVLYLILPFGGAFLTVEGVRHIAALAAKYLVVAGITAGPTLDPEATDGAEVETHHFHFTTLAATLLLGSFVFGLMHSAVFRGWVVRALLATAEGLRIFLVEWPARVLRLPAIRWLLSSGPVIWFGRYLARPMLAGTFVGLLSLLALNARESLVASVAAFLAACLFFSSRLAAELEEAFIDWLSRVWMRLSIDLIPALFHFIMAVFKRIVEAIDRMLYTVDEWLRFRTGESRWTFAWKLVLGAAWFVVSYIVRLYVNLFIEPTTNPIKHFPVVTVAHKIMAPFIVILFKGMTLYLDKFMNHALADAVAAVHVFLLPGIFGFLAWELKENWRLYRANQPKTLRPDMIGHHGETLRGLLRPSFHSGTVPKLYRKLRRAARVCDDAALRKQCTALHHVAQAVRHFTEREFIYLLELSRSWGKITVRASRVELGCTNIRVELLAPDSRAGSAWIVFEEQARSLRACMQRWGWLKNVNESSRRAFAVALAGWYAMAAVERNCSSPAAATPIPWQWWVDAWNSDQRGEGVPVLPDSGQGFFAEANA